MMKKTSPLKSCSKFHQLPPDLWPEILCKLPVKNLLRFRCVSNSWRTLIDDPNFARSHLALFNNNRLDSNLLFLEGHPTYEYVFRCTDDFKPNLELNQSGLPSIGSWNIFSSVDGLFILKENKFSRQTPPDIMLWNPSIRKTLIILHPSSSISEPMNVRDFGMGFDPLVKDYKYIRLVLIGGTSLQGSVYVYSLGTDSWRTIELQGDHSLRKKFSFQVNHATFCLRGVLYALARVGDSGDELVSFDLSRELFASTKLPTRLNLKLTIVDGGRSLAVINCYESGGSRSIWVLEGLEADTNLRSWCKRYTFATTIIPKKYPSPCSAYLHLGKNGEVLLNAVENMVTSYNLETHKEKIILRGNAFGYKAWSYMESLVLLKVDYSERRCLSL